MEAICVKLDERVIEQMDRSIKENYLSTRIDFIREAIRYKLHELEKRVAIRLLDKYRGSGKKRKQTSNENIETTREEVARETARRLGLELP